MAKTRLEMASHHYDEAANYQAMAMDRWREDSIDGAAWAIRMAADCLSLCASALRQAALEAPSSQKPTKKRVTP